jgi:hypothetical protein
MTVTIVIDEARYAEALESIGDAFEVSHDELCLKDDEFITVEGWQDWAVQKWEEGLDTADGGHRVSDAVNRAVEQQERGKRARKERVRHSREERAELYCPRYVMQEERHSAWMRDEADTDACNGGSP